MLHYNGSDEYRPLFYAGRLPVYVTTLLIATYTVAMVLFALISGFGARGFLESLPLSSQQLYEGAIWQPLTFLIYQPPGLGFLVEMVMFYMIGREVERFLGRNAFIQLYSSMALTIALLVAFYGLFTSAGAAGTTLLHFSIFICFALIYPNLEIIWVIQAKWLATALLALYSLILFSQQDWVGLGILWPLCFVAYIRCCGFGVTDRFGVYEFLCRILPARPPAETPIPKKSTKKETQSNRAVAGRSDHSSAPSAAMDTGKEFRENEDTHALIDPLLDKIAARGIGSLTPKEKQILESARTRFLQEEAKSKHR